VPDLVARAQGTELSGKYEWIEDITQQEAKDELVFRFHGMIAGIVKVLTSGRPNYWSDHAKRFLRLFSGPTVPLENMAVTLKRELAHYTQEELTHVGQLALYQAIEKTKTNYAGTAVICFKELIHAMTKNANSNLHDPMEFCNLAVPDHEPGTLLNVFLNSLPDDEQIIVKRALDGEKVSVPPALKAKLHGFLMPE